MGMHKFKKLGEFVKSKREAKKVEKYIFGIYG